MRRQVEIAKQKAQAAAALAMKKITSTVYQQIKSTDTKVEDRGDEIIIYWRKDTFFTVTIDLLKNPAVAEDRLEYFLGELMVKEARLIPPTLPQLPTPP